MQRRSSRIWAARLAMLVIGPAAFLLAAPAAAQRGDSADGGGEARAASLERLCHQRASIAAQLARENAVVTVQQLTQRQALDAAEVVELAEAHAMLGELDAACRALREAARTGGFARNSAVWRELAEMELRCGRKAAALQTVRRAVTLLPDSAVLRVCAARVYLANELPLGHVEIVDVRDGQVGCLTSEHLLLAERGDERFLAAPRESAVYQIRMALDLGENSLAAHLLHGRIWLVAREPQRAWEILQAVEVRLPAAPSDAVLSLYAEAALGADELSAFLRFSRRRAEQAENAGRRDARLAAAYREAAAWFNARGDGRLYVEFLRRAVQFDPSHAEAALALADALAADGDLKAAERWYRHVLEQAPLHPARLRIMRRLSASLQETSAAEGRKSD